MHYAAVWCLRVHVWSACACVVSGLNLVMTMLHVSGPAESFVSGPAESFVSGPAESFVMAAGILCDMMHTHVITDTACGMSVTRSAVLDKQHVWVNSGRRVDRHGSKLQLEACQASCGCSCSHLCKACLQGSLSVTSGCALKVFGASIVKSFGLLLHRCTARA
jgi:hypothetical protein